MKTLDQIPPAWSQIIPDGAKRFEVVMNGEAVLDKETGLVWLRSPDATARTLELAHQYCYDLTAGGRQGWRIPTEEELLSLVDKTVSGSPKLPLGHPFQNIQNNVYWSSTEMLWLFQPSYRYFETVYMRFGTVMGYNLESNDAPQFLVWPVRGGNNLGR
jgi:hypothetical protein